MTTDRDIARLRAEVERLTRERDATTASATYEGLVEAMAKLEPMPRDVLVFGGTLVEFKAALAAWGVEMRGPEILYPATPAAFPGIPPIGCLECWEVDGEVWVAGNYRDFEDARDGKIPVRRIGPGGHR